MQGMGNGTHERIPAHLMRYIVTQDYGAYDEVAHAVWRFVLLHTYAHLKETAHPAYAQGLFATGMSVERIVDIRDMDACLAQFGWGAVCVDGFIPPQAFVELQSLGILPIAADIRPLEHLAYTPAPDIIHEAAGHAPILVDPDYSAFIRRMGEAGKRAFTLPEDDAIYRAIYALSELKEDPSCRPEQIRAAEIALERAVHACTRASESAKLARLYWWTAEYGLIGTLDDYKIYGAGLLSSLGECHSCHAPNVQKRWLSASSVDQSYDITKPQPQLFVTQDFAQLSAVVDEVTSRFAYAEGGLDSLSKAHESSAVATLEFDAGVQLSGFVEELEHLEDGTLWGVRFIGPAQACLRGVPVGDLAPLIGLVVPLGPVDSKAKGASRVGSEVSLRYPTGLRVSGTLVRELRDHDGQLAAYLLANAELVASPWRRNDTRRCSYRSGNTGRRSRVRLTRATTRKPIPETRSFLAHGIKSRVDVSSSSCIRKR
jgi:phenylalanine-4-hydroxylase